MKTRISILAILSTLFVNVYSQSPEKFSYQAVVRNSSNELQLNSETLIQISILESTADGSSIYVEQHSPTTNDNGLLSILIGEGNAINGSFSSINWGDDSFYLKTEIDVDNNGSYDITGVSQLLSVPYALHSKSAELISGGINRDYIEALENRIRALETKVNSPDSDGDNGGSDEGDTGGSSTDDSDDDGIVDSEDFNSNNYFERNDVNSNGVADYYDISVATPGKAKTVLEVNRVVTSGGQLSVTFLFNRNSEEIRLQFRYILNGTESKWVHSNQSSGWVGLDISAFSNSILGWINAIPEINTTVEFANFFNGNYSSNSFQPKGRLKFVSIEEDIIDSTIVE